MTRHSRRCGTPHRSHADHTYPGLLPLLPTAYCLLPTTSHQLLTKHLVVPLTTYHVLPARYADRAKQIKVVVEVQENPTDKLIRELKAENAKLKKMLGALQALRGGRGVRVD